MPIYEYQCGACGHQLEALQKVSDEPLTECPECHKAALNKLVSAAGFQLKGSGWYVTDYSNKGKAKSSSKEGATGDSGTSTSSAAADTKSSKDSTSV